jgi:hypothetical protein
MQIGMSSAKPDDILKDFCQTMAATNSRSFDHLLGLSCSLQDCAVTGMEELIYLSTQVQSWQDLLAAAAAVGNIGIMRTAVAKGTLPREESPGLPQSSQSSSLCWKGRGLERLAQTSRRNYHGVGRRVYTGQQ